MPAHQPTEPDAILLSLNSEPGCIKVVDTFREAEGAALESLTSELYLDDAPDPEDVEKLKSLNLLGFLQEEVGNDSYDMGRIKVIFRALKIAKPPQAINYLRDNFRELVVFAKEIALLMQELEAEHSGCFNRPVVKVA